MIGNFIWGMIVGLGWKFTDSFIFPVNTDIPVIVYMALAVIIKYAIDIKDKLDKNE